jgi:hypothetical protein
MIITLTPQKNNIRTHAENKTIFYEYWCRFLTLNASWTSKEIKNENEAKVSQTESKGITSNRNPQLFPSSETTSDQVGNQDHFPKKERKKESKLSRRCSKTSPSNIPNSRCFHPYIRQRSNPFFWQLKK